MRFDPARSAALGQGGGIGLALLIAIVLLICGLALPACTPGMQLESGDRAPNFKASTLDGRTFYLHSSLQRPLLLSFYATWSEGCRRTLATLNRAEQSNSDRVQIVYVALQFSDQEQLRRTVEEMHLSSTVVLDADGSIRQSFRAERVPITFLISPAAEVLDVFDSASNSELLRMERAISGLQTDSGGSD